MPNIDFLCKTCAKPFLQYQSVHSQACPPCPECGAETERHWIPAHAEPSNAPPVVVFQAPDGSFRFPGSADGIYARKCEAEGCTRVELRGWADVRRFEGRVNAQELSKIQRRVERQQHAMAQGEAIRRSALFEGMKNGFSMPEVDRDGARTGRMRTVHLSPRSRDIAARLIALNNDKRVRGYEPGFHVDAYSHDRGNRDRARDAQGRRLRD